MTGSMESIALAAASELLDVKGNQPREYRNCLVFLAADSQRTEELEGVVADLLAWKWVVAESGATGLNLDPAQAAHAQAKLAEANRSVADCLGQTYRWLLVPEQAEPTGPITWVPVPVDGHGGLAERASERLIQGGYLFLSYPPAWLRQRLDADLASLWACGHVSVATLWEPFARYLYLHRLRDFNVLAETIAVGAAEPSWPEIFAIADKYQDDHYLGLVAGHRPTVHATTIVVQPDLASAQRGEPAKRYEGKFSLSSSATSTESRTEETLGDEGDQTTGPKYFRGAVVLNPTRLSRDFGVVLQEVVTQLATPENTAVMVTVEVSAKNPDGFPDATVRNVTENARELGFEAGSGFKDD